MFQFLSKLFSTDRPDYQWRSTFFPPSSHLSKADLQAMRKIMSTEIHKVQQHVINQRAVVTNHRDSSPEVRAVLRNQLTSLKAKRNKLEATLRNVKSDLGLM